MFGRKDEAADGAEPLEHPDPPLPPVDGMFRQPTDVAWDSQGNTYITDGYVNSRVAKYDKRGVWVKSWGAKGSGPGEFNTPHSIAIDRQDSVYVGDRANHRIQVFDTDGNFKRMFSIDVPPDSTTRPVNGATPTGEALMRAIGAPNSICITPGSPQVLVRRRVHVSGADLQGSARAARCSASSADRGETSASSPARTRSPVRRSTRSTSARRRTGVCRSCYCSNEEVSARGLFARILDRPLMPLAGQ